ncbi:MAG: rane-associated lipoprotein involved in thiamine biosynthesis [Mycobacterium sp.]|nr:rane-associated lipoprotein involved in thiamine biosynthesis [Mycobacterium sp.]
MEVVVTDPRSSGVARAEVEAELDAVEAAASRFRSDSEVCALARSAGQPTVVSDLLAEMIGVALTAARRTGGDVDPTIGAAVVALGYDRDFSELDEAPLMASSITVPATWSMITLDGRTLTVPAGVLLDLGATAKALAADRCARRVVDATGSGVLVNLGGDIATAGPAPEGGWQVLVRDSAEDPACSVAMPAGAGLATSSTVHRRWRKGGDLVHHILDPRSGLAADPVWRTVTVAAGTCVDANTISTAAIIRGRRALNWLRTLGVPARLVDSDRVVYTVGGWPASDPGRHR